MHRPLTTLRSGALVAAAVLLALGVLTGCGSKKAASDDAQSIVVSGSTTLMPIAEQAAEEYGKAHPGTSVLVSGVGSSAGIEAVSSGTAAIGTSSRDLKGDETHLGLVDTPVARDGIAVIVNPDNPVKNLTTAQLRGIFAGTIVNWKQVGGPDLGIERVNRDEASGTREAFSKIIMGTTAFDNDSVVLPGTGQVRQVVSRTKGAVGYISVGFVTDEVRAVPVDGIVPTRATVTSGTYPIARELHFFTKGKATGLARLFLNYVLSDDVQRGAVVEAGFVPVAGHAKGGE